VEESPNEEPQPSLKKPQKKKKQKK